MNPTRQKLLDTSLAIATEKRLLGLTVRELAATAEVNLGSFVYHFGNRAAFIDELVELWYAPLYDELKAVAAKGYYPSAIATFEATMEALIGLMRQVQAESSLAAGHPLKLMIFIMGSVGLPLVIAGSGRQLGWLPE